MQMNVNYHLITVRYLLTITFNNMFNSQNLERAFLTHSFHCCAFKFPSRHDPLRHVEQLKLMDRFRAECKLKGYMQQSSEAMKSNESLAEFAEIISAKVKRSLSTRLVRSGSISAANETFYSMSTISQEYEDNSNSFMDEDIEGGFFHSPATLPNEYLEAICGNLSEK